MAIVKYATKRDVISVFEDINTGKNTIYLEGEGFNKTTLAYKHNSHMIMLPGSSRTNYIGSNIYRRTSADLGTTTTGVTNRSGAAPGQTMALAKDVAYAAQTIFGASQITDAARIHPTTNIPPVHLMCMDPQLQRGVVSRVVSNDLAHAAIIWYIDNFPSIGGRTVVWQIPAVGGTPELNEIPPGYVDVQPFSTSFTTQGYNLAIPTIEDQNTRFVSELVHSTMIGKTNTGPVAPTFGVKRINILSGARSGLAQPTTPGAPLRYYDNCTGQYIGKRADNKPYYLFTSNLNDHTHTILTHNAGDDTVTVNFTLTTSPGAAGKNKGGTRSTNIMGRFNKYSSKTFQSTTNPQFYYWYTPYFDNSLNYFPFLFTWDKSSDNISRNNVSITGSATEGLSTLFGGPWPSYSGSIPGLITQQYTDPTKAITGGSANTAGLSCIQYNESFLSGGNRYLTLFTFTGQYNYYGSASTGTASANGPRVVFTYQVNIADPSALTFHSSFTVPDNPKSVVFLNDQKTLVGIICDNSVVIYTWNNVDGWVLTTTIPGIFTSLGRDSTDRIWATEATVDNDYVHIHTLTVGTPVRIVLRTALNNYDYEGTVINTTLDVAAYNFSNQRIATGVTLSIVGSTLTFDLGATSTFVETSVAGDVNIPLRITGAGISDIVATINI